MSDILFNFIKDKVYKDKEIREISLNSYGKATNWIFDFKSQSLSRCFLEEYVKSFWKNIENYNLPEVQVGGMESGAISLITGVSLLSGNKVIHKFYIRKSRKKNDLANLIEGDLRKNIPIVLIDDILNSGDTIRKEIKILEELNHKVFAIFVCIRYRDLTYYQDLINKGVKVISIFELNDFSNDLPVKNIILENREPFVEKYKIDYKVTLTQNPNLYLVVPKSAPLIIGGHIYIGADDGNFFCIDSKDAVITWKYKVPFGSKGKNIFSSPAIYKDKVIFGAYDGNVYCFDRFTGKREWVFLDADWVGSSPCINQEEGIVYIGLEFGLYKKQGGVVAIEIESGKVKWKNYTMRGLTHASPSCSIKNKLVICGCNDGCVYAFNIETGYIVWKFKTGGEIKYGSVFDDKRGLVVVPSMDGFAHVLHLKDGSLYFKFSAKYGFYSTPALYEDLVVIGSLDKNIYCFNLETMETEWVFETNGRILASPLVEGRSVFIGSNDGCLYEIDVVSGVLISRVQFTERIVNKVQVSYSLNNKKIVYVPTHACELYKISEI